uniref:7TM_GPCR_Srx domain-containing protein n=1 Tax=Caenorhabditis tropicalis TaxID=1561998 RepID=A0A1I7V222_9PELO
MDGFLSLGNKYGKPSNGSDDTMEDLLEEFNIYKIIVDVLNNSSFLLLIVYRRVKTINTEDIHSPIFNQLFYVSAFCVILNGIAVSIRIIWDYGNFSHDSDLFLFYSTIAVFGVWYLMSSIIFCSIVMFTFLSAIQRIIILYIPKLKFLVTGYYSQILPKTIPNSGIIY